MDSKAGSLQMSNTLAGVLIFKNKLLMIRAIRRFYQQQRWKTKFQRQNKGECKKIISKKLPLMTMEHPFKNENIHF